MSDLYLADVLAGRPEPGHQGHTGPVTEALFERLLPEDVEAVEQAMEGSARDAYLQAPEHARPRLVLVLGVHYGISGVLERTGLLQAVPPERVHAMGRGPFAAGGDLYTADLIAGCLEGLGFSWKPGLRVFDFGCSSGRHLRALAAWRPDLDYCGCDPNHEAVAWARENLPIGRFFPSETTPPVDLEDQSVDLALAVSIWSHYSASAAETWLEEMRRVIVPGGLLLMTTHGWDALGGGVSRDMISRESVQAAAEGMLLQGHHFIDVFGEGGDWGVDATDWGNAYMTLDWLCTRLHSRWALRAFVPGGLDRFQDIVVLQRAV